MNSTYFFTDFAVQQAEYAQLKFLKSEGLFETVDFIGLFGNASLLTTTGLDKGNAAVWGTLSSFREVYVCPSAAARRGIDIAHTNPPRPGLRWLSLAAMLERIAPIDGEPRAMAICLSTDTDLARTEALELCLAALALDFDVQLSLRGAGVLGLQRSLARAGAKGFASLAIYGLAHALIAPTELSALAPLTLMPDALTLPWQLGIATRIPMMFEF